MTDCCVQYKKTTNFSDCKTKNQMGVCKSKAPVLFHEITIPHAASVKEIKNLTAICCNYGEVDSLKPS